MLKKRVIFTLLYSNGQFMLSRNFRLQKVGNFEWLQSNYNFSQISFSIDELIVLDVTRGEKCIDSFCASLKKIANGCFVPIAAGGGVKSLESARKLLRSGADKIVINTSLYEGNGFAGHLALEFGRQCVVASMDIKASYDGNYQIWKEGGNVCLNGHAAEWVQRVLKDEVGELYLNSIDRDGTGQGYDLGLLDLLPTHVSMPIILAGGVGNATHLAVGLADNRVDAVATANLLNFVGDGLRRARNKLISDGIDLPFWDIQRLKQHLSSARST
jgi:imidazole glycerol-phosphate synthase subunit HisF